MDGLQLKAIVEGVGVLLALGIIGFLLIRGEAVDESLKVALIALIALAGAYFGFSSLEHLKRKENDGH